MPNNRADQDEPRLESELRELTEKTRKLREELREMVRGETGIRDLPKGRVPLSLKRPTPKKRP